MIRKRVKVFFDGGCRPNPGPIEAAVVMRGVAHFFDGLGSGTSNGAEWVALIRGLELAQVAGLRDFVMIGDALDVISRAQSVLETEHEKSRHEETLKLLLGRGRPARIRWIKREQNLAGISLAARRPRRVALDTSGMAFHEPVAGLAAIGGCSAESRRSANDPFAVTEVQPATFIYVPFRNSLKLRHDFR